MSKHTPGPWLTDETQPFHIFVLRVAYADEPLQRRNVAQIAPHSQGSVCSPVSAEGEANARLIASAPDLLEVAETMLSLLDGTRGKKWEGEYADKVRSVLAKARVGNAP